MMIPIYGRWVVHCMATILWRVPLEFIWHGMPYIYIYIHTTVHVYVHVYDLEYHVYVLYHGSTLLVYVY